MSKDYLAGRLSHIFKEANGNINSPVDMLAGAPFQITKCGCHYTDTWQLLQPCSQCRQLTQLRWKVEAQQKIIDRLDRELKELTRR